MNFRDIILTLPQQIKTGFLIAKNIKIDNYFNQIIFCCMGGSALAPKLIKTLRDYLKINKSIKLYSHENYGLPDIMFENSLIIILSYSGDTEETLSAYNEAIKRNLKIIAIGAGGKLKELAKKDRVDFIEIPSGLPPRSAIGYFLGIILRILSNAVLIRNIDKDIDEASGINPIDLENQGKELANFLINKIILIYSSEQYYQLICQWKIRFNENAQTLAFGNYIPKLCHTDIAAYKDPQTKEISVIILKDEKEKSEILKTMNKIEKILNEYKIPFKTVALKGENQFIKIINSVILADWTSYYLALIKKVNPFDNQVVEKFKNLKI